MSIVDHNSRSNSFLAGQSGGWKINSDIVDSRIEYKLLHYFIPLHSE